MVFKFQLLPLYSIILLNTLFYFRKGIQLHKAQVLAFDFDQNIPIKSTNYLGRLFSFYVFKVIQMTFGHS